jgi:glutamine amidotransferase-like uncharacterized protein
MILTKWISFPAFLLTLTTATLTGCQSEGDSLSINALPDTSKVDPVNPSEDSPKSGKDVLLFNGTGVATSDWQNTEKLIAGQGWSYSLINSAELNAMTLEEISSYRLIVVPGGKGGSIANALTPSARLRVRQAVRDRGVGYVGFCAGAWISVGPEAEGNATAAYGLAVAPGTVLPSYWPDGNTNLTAAMVKVSLADGSSRQLVWWGGPSTPEWTGGVIGRYPTGAPAISQKWSGKGLVVISGPHPEAPQGWRATAGTDSDGLDYELAIAMMTSAMNGRPMATF